MCLCLRKFAAGVLRDLLFVHGEVIFKIKIYSCMYMYIVHRLHS